MHRISSRQREIRATRPFEHLVKIKTEGNNLGMIKTILISLLLILQIGAMAVGALLLVSVIRWYLVFAVIMTAITCLYVLSSNRNSQSKTVWVMFLILGFAFGYIIFYFSDEHIFFRKQKKRYNEIFERSYNFQQESVVPKQTSAEVKRDVNYFEKTGKFCAYSKTNLKYFASGTMLFDDMLKEIEKAKKFVFIEYFIISDGVLLNRLINVLKRKKEQGLDIRLIYDDMGSHRSFKLRTRKKLKELGVKIYKFNQLISWFSFGLNYRDHRKIVVIDGKIAYTGGANFADEYINEKRMHGYWKDAGVKLMGNAVDGLTLTFLRQWQFVTKESTEFSPYVGLSKDCEGSSVVVPYADGLDYSDSIGRDAYANLIASAKQKLYIMTPYFITDDVIFSLLKNKAESGVDVRIILPSIPDKKTVYRVSRNNAEKLAEFGVKFYVMKNSFVHSKVVLSENAAIVGSINFDLRSFYQQFEDAVYTNDKNFMREVNEDFEQTFKASVLVTKEKFSRRKLINRMIAGVLGIVSPFM